MAKGYGGMPQGFNMNNIMKQAQKMQQQMEKTQEELAGKTIEVTAGGGAAKIEITGNKELKSVKLDPEVVDPDDVEMLEDLILTGVNEAIRRAEELSRTEMAKVTGSAGMPGGMF